MVTNYGMLSRYNSVTCAWREASKLENTELNPATNECAMSKEEVMILFDEEDFTENPTPKTQRQPLLPPEFTGNIYTTSPSGARVMDPARSVLVLGAAGTPIQEALAAAVLCESVVTRLESPPTPWAHAFTYATRGMVLNDYLGGISTSGPGTMATHSGWLVHFQRSCKTGWPQ